MEASTMRASGVVWALVLILGRGLLLTEGWAQEAPAEAERWWVGLIGDVPVMSLHEVEQPRDGGWDVRSQSRVRFSVTGGGGVDIDHLVHTEENDDGFLQRMVAWEQHADGAHVALVVSVLGDTQSWRLRIEDGHGIAARAIEMPPEAPRPLGPRGQRLAVAAARRQGLSAWSGTVLRAVGGDIRVVEERIAFDTHNPEAPPWQVLIGEAPGRAASLHADGALMAMDLHLLGHRIAVCRHHAPVVLEGQKVEPQFIIPGRRPNSANTNHVRLSAAALTGAARDAFQSVRADGILLVRAEGEVGACVENGRDPTLLQASPGIEVDDEELAAWIAPAFVPEHRRESAQAMATYGELLVRARLGIDPNPVGDASAKEAWQQKRGDCTEHARLLTAVLRYLGVPAQPVLGVVYDPLVEGWRAHAWVAYFDARHDSWRHADSALPGVSRTAYLAVAPAVDSKDLDWAALAAWLPRLREEGIR